MKKAETKRAADCANQAAGISISIDRASRTPAYRQLYHQISSQIREGTLAAGSYLPKIRDLSQELRIARNTVEAAYRQLALEGYATGIRGKGYVIEKLDLSPLLTSKDSGVAHHATTNRTAKRRKGSPSPTTPGRNPLGDDMACRFDFAYGNRSPEDFPMHLWRSHAEKVMTSGFAKLASSYMDPFGLPALRHQLASYLAETRNVTCDSSQIVLLPGTQSALLRICTLLSSEKSIVGMENPGYNAAKEVFQDCGWSVRSIPTHKSAQAFMGSVEKSGASLLFCTPSNQFPLGYTLPIATRLELIGWAKRTGAFIIEDDYCCEYRYDGFSPIPSLQSLDPDHVIYMGTLSKVLTPAIRISYIVLPPSLISRWEKVHGHYYCPIDWMSQATVQSFMSGSDWERYVRATMNRYHRKHATLMQAIEHEMGGRVHLVGERTGLHMLVGDSLKRSQAELIDLAVQNDVRVYETHPYWMSRNHPMDNYVLLGFSSIPERNIIPGIKALARAWYG